MSITYNVLAPASPALVAVWVKIIIAYNVLAPASPALVGGLWNAHSLAMERLKFGYRPKFSITLFVCLFVPHGSEMSPWGRFHQKNRLLTLPLGENYIRRRLCVAGN